MNRFWILTVFLVGLFCLVTGWMDADWQLVQYRYSEWHRTVDYWEYNPFLQVNWWIAWQLNLLRVVFGSAFMGAIASHLWRRT